MQTVYKMKNEADVQDSKQAAIDTLKHRVLCMELEPGELLDEVSLSKELGISRTPLREALQRLSGEGFLTLEKNRGAKVTSMDFATLRHFFQAAPMVYAAIARLAAESATPAQIAQLKDIQRAFRLSLEEERTVETALLNHHFHEQIGRMAASPYLISSLNRLLIDHTRIGQMFFKLNSDGDTERVNTAADQHDAMIDAFTTHSPALAVDLTLQHWELSRGMMEKFVRPDPLAFSLADAAETG